MNQSAELADATLRDVAGFLRNKVASPGDLVSGCLERIERFDPFLHAFLQRRDAAALETARVAAKTLGDDGTSLLTGVPLAHKDMFYRTGELVTFGAHPRRAQRPSFTATVKMRLDALHVPDLGSLNMSATNAGNSFNSFESTEDCFGRPLAIQFRQSALGFAIDDLRRLFGLAPPNYMKIDVDGIEAQILAGAAQTLADPALRSVLVELEHADTERNAHIVEPLVRAGFVLSLRGANQAGSANGLFVRPQTR